jgi:hypothetical protein
MDIRFRRRNFDAKADALMVGLPSGLIASQEMQILEFVNDSWRARNPGVNVVGMEMSQTLDRGFDRSAASHSCAANDLSVRAMPIQLENPT